MVAPFSDAWPALTQSFPNGGRDNFFRALHDEQRGDVRVQLDIAPTPCLFNPVRGDPAWGVGPSSLHGRREAIRTACVHSCSGMQQMRHHIKMAVEASFHQGRDCVLGRVSGFQHKAHGLHFGSQLQHSGNYSKVALRRSGDNGRPDHPNAIQTSTLKGVQVDTRCHCRVHGVSWSQYIQVTKWPVRCGTALELMLMRCLRLHAKSEARRPHVRRGCVLAYSFPASIMDAMRRRSSTTWRVWSDRTLWPLMLCRTQDAMPSNSGLPDGGVAKYPAGACRFTLTWRQQSLRSCVKRCTRRTPSTTSSSPAAWAMAKATQHGRVT
eukprot:1706214-Prymnesium_polylepis.1